MISPTDYLRLVLDPVRLAVLGSAAQGAADVERMAVSLGVTERRVLEAIGRLRRAGLLDEELGLVDGVLQDVAAALPRLEPPAAAVTDGEWSAEEAALLARFFSGSRLREIPAQRSKRMVVLERLVQEFEPGLRYPEPEVSRVLQLFHPDYAALRRHLVDEGLLTRAEGYYWRTGGRVRLSA